MSFSKLFDNVKQRKATKETTSAPPPKSSLRPSHSEHQNLKPSRKRRRNSPKQKQKPSEQALHLSAELKELSRQKRLEQVKALYWQNRGMTDAHHACTLVDCCARCGDVAEAERIVHDCSVINVELQTALLKAYAHAGWMHKAETLFEQLCQSSDTKPNVRTLNTLLRGCLWTAASEQDGKSAGGVLTSEKAWGWFHTCTGDEFDSSSYEYSVILLSQALRTDEASDRISEFQKKQHVRVKGTASLIGECDYSVMESLAAMYVSLARAFAIRGMTDEMWTSCQRALNAVQGAKTRLTQTGEQESHSVNSSASGGKRARRPDEAASGRRMQSNFVFRNHRLNELEADARKLLKLRRQSDSRAYMPRNLLSSRFFVSFATRSRGSFSLKQSHFALRHSFGGDVLSVEQTANVRFPESLLSDDKPMDIELGAGFGDWIVEQAQSNPQRTYMAVELRADRAYHILSKAALNQEGPLENVYVIGSDAGSFLQALAKEKPVSRVSNIYANHPEPPTQTFGSSQKQLDSILSNGDEPSHMLCSSTLLTASKVLRQNGQILVVTDNRWYARLLAATFARALRHSKQALRNPTRSEWQALGLRSVDVFDGGVAMFETSPDGKGRSWFDRLWRAGAGAHAETKTRFVLLLCKS